MKLSSLESSRAQVEYIPLISGMSEWISWMHTRDYIGIGVISIVHGAGTCPQWGGIKIKESHYDWVTGWYNYEGERTKIVQNGARDWPGRWLTRIMVKESRKCLEKCISKEGEQIIVDDLRRINGNGIILWRQTEEKRGDWLSKPVVQVYNQQRGSWKI